jgi:Ca2+-binding EF-hand superfamily protein
MKQALALLSSLALLSVAAADDRTADDDKSQRGATNTFQTLDADSDGKLSKEEVAGNDALSGSFDRLDSNSDGFVSKREFRRNTMPRRETSDF